LSGDVTEPGQRSDRADSAARVGGARYLRAADVEAAMPPVEERLALAEQTLASIGTEHAELPAKIGVHPRPPASFGHAMPALLRGDDPDGRDDRLGMKWVTGVPGNTASGMPAISAIVVLSDPLTGRPRAILDGGPITAQRTAAISGVVIGRFRSPAGTIAPVVALLGAGIQARSHVPVLAHVLPGATIRVHDRHPDRAAEVAGIAWATGAFAAVDTSADAVATVTSADIVVTMFSFGADRQSIPAAAFERSSLVVAVDYDMSVPAAIAAGASAFLVDEPHAFLANRGAGIFRGYPDPGGTIGEAIREDRRHPGGRVVVTHLGVGLADVVLGSAVADRASELGLGITLPA
jgi:ornithine cyclodeaminase/alanine dehydrogenase-like protein (mu-crystallin family)